MKSPSLPTRVWRTTQQCMKERPLVSSVEKLNPLQVTLQGSSDSKFNNQLYIWRCNINLPTSMDYGFLASRGSYLRGSYEKQGLYQCPQCDKRFESPKSLSNHRSSTWLQDHLHNLWRSRVNKDQPESTPENNPPGNLCPVNDQKGNNINSGPFLKLPCF